MKDRRGRKEGNGFFSFLSLSGDSGSQNLAQDTRRVHRGVPNCQQLPQKPMLLFPLLSSPQTGRKIDGGKVGHELPRRKMKEDSIHILPLQLLPCVLRANWRGGRCAGESLSHPHFAAGCEERRRSGKVELGACGRKDSQHRAYLAVLVLDIIRQFPKHFHGSA